MPNDEILRLTVDRTESGIIVCFDDNNNKYELFERETGKLADGDIIYARFSEGMPIFLSTAHDETEAEKSALQERLKRIFGKQP